MNKKSISVKRFSSKRDLLIMALLVSTIGFLVFIFLSMNADAAVSQNELWFFGLPFLLLNAALIVWIMLQTYYELSSDKLKIVCGPFRKSIAIESINKIEESHSIFSAPALSFDRLKISYGSNKSILISPEEKREFIRAVELMKEKPRGKQ